MDSMTKWFDWLRDEQNREALILVGGALAAVIVAGWTVYTYFSGRKVRTAGGLGPPSLSTVTLTLDDYEQRLTGQATEVEAKLAGKFGSERADLEEELAELRRHLGEVREQLANLQSSHHHELAKLEAARATFQRDEHAEGEMRLDDAARHYGKATAAEGLKRYEHLVAAQKFAYMDGDYRAALKYGAELLQAAESEFGPGSSKHAFALNLQGVTLHRMGRYADAEPIYRQLLEIDEKDLERNPLAYLVTLDNLAQLLTKMRHYADAEVLYQKGLGVATEKLDAEHPFTRRLTESLAASSAALGVSLQNIRARANGAP